MHRVHLHHITVNYHGREILNDITWAIGDNQRIGLVGPNGAGKSTLLKVINGDVTIESGQIVIHSGTYIGYLPQDIHLPSDMTLFEAAMILPPRLAEVEAQLSEIETHLANPDIYGDEAKLSEALTRQEVILDQYERLNGSRHGSRVRELLAVLGFQEAQWDLAVDALSGGQKKLVALVQLAVSSLDVLLLDEPDNHLDKDGKHYLENFINQYKGTIVLVSHDRYLLDEVATQIVELDNGIEIYPGNYTHYTTERELRRLRQQQLYVAQQKEIAAIEAAIARFELWASLVIDERHIRQARSRRKMLDRMEANGEIIEAVREAKRMDFKLAGWRGSTKALEIINLCMAFEDEFIFTDINLILRHGEHIGLVGANGAGKSVLFKLILGEYLPFEGIIKIGPSTKIGYYSQEHQTLEKWLDKTPIDLVRNLRDVDEGKAVSFLTKMLFDYQQTRQKIRTMSGGERSRLQLAILMLNQPNFLLLDEPTNNLDIPSVEVLEEVLSDFEGTILTISHDRYFLDQIADQIVELKDGAIKTYLGGYTDYLAKASS